MTSRKRRTLLEIVKSTPSEVAQAAILHSGSGKHGKQSRRERSKANRRDARMAIRSWDE